MARPSKAERLNSVFQRSLTEYNRVQSALRSERELCRQARRFASIPGAQWEGLWAEAFASKPRLEMNKIMMAVIRIMNEMRNNRIAVDFVPKDGAPDDELADTLDGLFRADYEDSNGDEAVDNASDEAVSGGYGAVRLRTKYEDEYDDEDERQRICLEPIFDADTSVFFDLDAKRQDKADAKRCWVVYSMTHDAFKEAWGQDPTTWPKMATQGYWFDWSTPDVVYVAEYYQVEDESVRMVRFQMPDETTHEFEADDVEEAEAGEKGDEYDEIRQVIALGGVAVKEWRKRCRRVHKYIMSGGGILEDCGYIAGKHIPIVPMYGKRWFIDNVERCMGVTQIAMDAQRLDNMQTSKLAEIAALSSRRKPIVHPEQISGHEVFWQQDNVEDYAYLTLNPLTGPDGQPIPGGPVAYNEPPDVPPAMAALLQITRADMNELLGVNQQAEKMVPNISGKAVEMIQQRQDMQSFIFMDNRAKMMRRVGEVWLSMAQEIYVEDGRKMKAVNEDGTAAQVELNKPIIDEKTGALTYANDLTRAKMDVTVDVGPSYTSRRQATVSALTAMMQMSADPADQKVLLSAALMNMEGEGLGDIRKWSRRQLVGMGVVEPNDEERAEMAAAAQAQQQPDAQTIYLQAEAAKAQAQGQLAVANTEKALADAEKARAQTAETLAGIETDRVKTAIEAAQAIGGAIAGNSPPQGL